MAAGAGSPLAARELPVLLARVHDALAARREAIDDLNVFPVPDGDTGTNMVLTVRAGLDALRRTSDASPPELARAVVRGAVRGARGNSGVILSQVIRAVVDVVSAEREVDGPTYARALEEARALAYEAVAEPVEGTILTAIAAAARAAQSAVTSDATADLVAVSTAVVEATRTAVERTRDQLEVLRAAGVVDAGARGFEVVVNAVHGHLTGEDPPIAVDSPHELPHETVCHADAVSHRYEVQYLLDADDADAAPLRQRLELLGDSVVVVAAGGLLNVHVHTDDVGAAIEEGLRFGEPSDIEVTHFGDQIAANRAGAPTAVVGAVVVLDGDGLRRIAEELGATVVAGRAGALPSVADLLNAIGDVRAERVLLLPGHRNAVAAAHKAVEVAVAEGGRPLDVVADADSPCAVLSALAVFDPAGPADQVVQDAMAAAKAVRAGEVVAAVRDADTPLGPVRAGRPLVVVEGDVREVGETPLGALEHLCRVLDVDRAEMVTLLLGADAEPAEREHAVELVRGACGGDLEVIDAGQRPARYWLGVE